MPANKLPEFFYREPEAHTQLSTNGTWFVIWPLRSQTWLIRTDSWLGQRFNRPDQEIRI